MTLTRLDIRNSIAWVLRKTSNWRYNNDPGHRCCYRQGLEAADQSLRNLFRELLEEDDPDSA